MSLLKQIDEKSATLAWSPVPQQGNLVAIGTRDGGGGGFDDYGGELEIHKLDFSKRDTKTKVVGTVRTNGRFTSLAWSALYNKRADFPLGVVAGGLADGTVGIWDPAKLAANHPQPRIAAVQRHQGPVNGLHFNPSQNSSHLLASGGADNEVFVLALDRPDTPNVFIPAPAPNTAKHTAEVSKVAWNPQVPHILATCSGNGSTIVWDLRQKKPYCEMRDPARGPVADIAWNPDEGLHIVTASGDDNNPVIRLWDLRSSTTHPLATLKGHEQGLLSVSWCPFDSSFLLSTGRDNKTLLWDLYNVTPIYELPSAMPESDAYGGYGSSQQRRYNATWSPLLPAVVGTCSFNRTVEFYSLTGVRSTTGRAPKWLRRPVSASLGFGGKLAYVVNDVQAKGAPKRGAPSKRPILHLKNLVEDEELVAASHAFQAAVALGDYKSFCAAKASAARSGEERQVWAVLQTVVDKDSKSQLNHTLGYDEASLASAASARLSRPPSTTPTPRSIATPSPALRGLPSPGSALANKGASAAEGWDFGDEASAGTSSTPINDLAEGAAALSMSSPLRGAAGSSSGGSSTLPGHHYSEAENQVKRALLAGTLESAVNACLENDLVAEALLLASAPDAGAELWAKTKDAYVSRQAGKRPLLRIIDAILKTDLSDLVAQSDLSNWQETLALINTYSKAGDFGPLSERLGARLESEKGDRASATLCYLCSLNVDKAVRYWVDSLKESKARLGRTDTVALHYFVEKVTVLGSAIPGVHLPDDVSALFSEYAELLAVQGDLEVAYQYVNQANDIPTAFLRDRIFHASSSLRQRYAEPPRPFAITQVNLTAGAGQRTTATQQAQVTRGAQMPSTTAAAAAAAKQSSVIGQVQQPPATAAGPSLPPGWVSLIDHNTGRTYYANNTTQETSWDPPPMPAPVVAAPAVPHHHQVGGGGRGYAQPTHQPQQPQQQAASRVMSPGQYHHPTTVTQPTTAHTAARPLDYYADSFTSSHGNAALAQKYGNAGGVGGGMGPGQSAVGGGYDQQSQSHHQYQQHPLGGAAMPMMSNTGPVAQPTIFQPNKAAAIPSPVPAPAPASGGGGVSTTLKSPSPVQATPAEVPAEALPILEALNDLTQALAASPSLSSGDKRQLGDVVKGVNVLSNKLAGNEMPPDVLEKILHLAQAVQQRDFAIALAIQSDFATTIWDTHKEWIKPMKVLIQLCKKL